MKTAIIIPAMMVSEHLNVCIQSLFAGGYGDIDEDVYVVSHDAGVDKIKQYHENIKFVYTPGHPLPTDMNLFKAYSLFEKKYDLMAFVHADALFFDGWWDGLKSMWNHVDINKIGCLTVPTKEEPKRGQQGPFNMSIGMDTYNGDYCDRWLPCTSFKVSTYEDLIKKYGTDTYFSLEYHMLWDLIIQHKWSMMINNGSFVTHGMGTDCSKYDMGPFLSKTYEAFHRSFGYNLEHFMGIWLGTIKLNHADEIVENINAETFDKIDYIFDVGLKALDNINCYVCNTSLKDGRVLRCRQRDRPKGVHGTY